MINTDNFDEKKIIFANYVSGIKGMPLNTTVLLVNNVPNNSLDLIVYLIIMIKLTIVLIMKYHLSF